MTTSLGKAIRIASRRAPLVYLWKARQAMKSVNAARDGRILPAALKQAIVREFGHRYSIDTFVETGTYLGDMVWAVRQQFKCIYTIELDSRLASAARRRFGRYPHICVIEGDSGVVLGKLVKQISRPCLFWLDAHYSSGVTAKADMLSPVLKEVDTVLAEDNVILIDDADSFVGTDGYPTLTQLKETVAAKCPEMVFEVSQGVIRIHK